MTWKNSFIDKTPADAVVQKHIDSRKHDLEASICFLQQSAAYLGTEFKLEEFIALHRAV